MEPYGLISEIGFSISCGTGKHTPITQIITVLANTHIGFIDRWQMNGRTEPKVAISVFPLFSNSPFALPRWISRRRISNRSTMTFFRHSLISETFQGYEDYKIIIFYLCCACNRSGSHVPDQLDLAVLTAVRIGCRVCRNRTASRSKRHLLDLA